MKKFKINQNGAISLFILIAILFFTIVLMNLYINTANRANKQIETTNQTIDIYSKNTSDEEMENLYKSYFGDENLIPIYTAEQLQTLAKILNGSAGVSEYVTINQAGGKIYEFTADKVYLLRNDIDASGINPWISIGTNAHPFTGTFEGANHTIKNLTNPTSAGIEENYQGLFGTIGESAEVRNIKVITGE